MKHNLEHKHQQEKQWDKHLTINITNTQSNSFNKINQTHVQTLYFSNPNNNSKIQESRAINMKSLAKIRKPIPFPWRFEVEMMQKCRFFDSDTRWVWKRVEMGKTMNSHRSSRENWKVLKTNQFAQNTQFSRVSQVTCKSPRPAARTLKDKNLKNFLSREINREHLCIPLTIGPSTRKQVVTLSRVKQKKTQILKNILSIFHD